MRDGSQVLGKGQMHRRDFLLGGIKVSLSFLALDALGFPAFARQPGPAQLPASLDDSLRVMAGYVARYAPPQGNFPTTGAWKATYDVLECTSSRGSKHKLDDNRVAGRMAVTGSPVAAGAGVSYDVDYAITMHDYESSLKSTMQCSAERMPRLMEWKTDYENHAVATPGLTVKLSEQGSHKDGVLGITNTLGTRQLKTDRPVVPQWAVMDALRGAKADPSDPIAGLEFDMLHDMTSYRPHQRLKPCGVLNMSLDGKPYVFHGFMQTGMGTEPTHYWIDDAGRPLLLTAGLLSSAMTSLQKA